MANNALAELIDAYEAATTLRVVDVFRPGNETGYVTPPDLYEPRRTPDGRGWEIPPRGNILFWMDHATVGTNTLPYFAGIPGVQLAGSVRDGRDVCCPYLIPKDRTLYADGRVADTSRVVFKMTPANRACNHTGPCVPFTGVTPDNANTDGVEYENLQNGADPFTEWQIVKGALIYVYSAVVNRIPDYRRVSHGVVAEPWGRRTDPFTRGMFPFSRSWAYVEAIRRDPRIWQFWKLPQPAR